MRTTEKMKRMKKKSKKTKRTNNIHRKEGRGGENDPVQ